MGVESKTASTYEEASALAERLSTAAFEGKDESEHTATVGDVEVRRSMGRVTLTTGEFSVSVKTESAGDDSERTVVTEVDARAPGRLGLVDLAGRISAPGGDIDKSTVEGRVVAPDTDTEMLRDHLPLRTQILGRASTGLALRVLGRTLREVDRGSKAKTR